jgi:O-antigen/teichoic acid export membrane protein
MVDRRKIVVNAGTVLLQVAISGVIWFLLYRYLVRTIGIQKLGVWSVVLATSLATAIGDFGLAGGVVRFVAKYRARSDFERASAVVQTAAVTIAILFALLLTLGYPLFLILLRIVLPGSALADGRMLLPFALVSLWINSVGGVFQAGLDGLQRNALRSIVTLSGSLLLLIAARILVARRGLEGLAIAQLVQGGFVLLVSWLLLKKEIPALPLLPFRWRRDLFKEMARYGAGFQLMTIATMLFDPITKALLARFGGLTSAGYYEMANRMVMQLRALIVNANQVLVPVIADLHETTPELVADLYTQSMRVLLFFALPFYSVVIVITPVVSRFWLGTPQIEFIAYATLLAIGWLCNTISGPAYFSNLGTGYLRWNIVGQVSIGVLNATLGFALGRVAGGIGVVVAWTLALIAGSSLILFAHARTHNLSPKEIVPPRTRRLALGCMAAVMVTLLTFNILRAPLGFPLSVTIGLAAFLLITAPFVWRDPLRPRLSVWLISQFKTVEQVGAVG